MGSSDRAIVAAMVASAWFAAAAGARAEPRQAVLVGGDLVVPMGEDHVAHSLGLRVDLDLQPQDDEPLVLLAGAAVAFGVDGIEDRPERRDLYDLHFDLGLRIPGLAALMPYVAAGLDVLGVTTRLNDEVSRGTTLGANAQIGMASFLGRRWMLRFFVQVLSAIVPVTGDDLRAVTVSVALGTGRSGPPEPEPTPEPPPPPDTPVPPPVTGRVGQEPPPWLAGAATIALDCAPENVGVESTTDEQLGCGEMAATAGCQGALVYRHAIVTGCGRRAELRCYVGSGSPSCVPETTVAH